MILILGSRGFLGCEVKAQLKEMELPFVVFDKKPNLHDNLGTNEYFSEVTDFLKSNNIDRIINCAVKYDGNQDLIFTNVLLPLKILKYLDNLKQPTIFINYSSFFQKFPYYPFRKKYTISKQFLESFFEDYKNTHIYNLQLEHMYGPNDKDYKFIPWVVKQLSNNEDITLTDCDQQRDFIHVEDVARFSIKLITQKGLKLNGDLKHYEVGTGIPTSFKKFISLLKENLNSSSKLMFGSIERNENEIMYSTAKDTQKLFERYQWKPQITVVDGVKMFKISK
jgi:nucleoside-diphosphate-sugar epimerase